MAQTSLLKMFYKFIIMINTFQIKQSYNIFTLLYLISYLSQVNMLFADDADPVFL